MRHSRREIDAHPAIAGVVTRWRCDVNAVLVDYGELFQRVRMLGIPDVADHIKDLLFKRLMLARSMRLSIEDFDAGIGVVQTVAIHDWCDESRCNSERIRCVTSLDAALLFFSDRFLCGKATQKCSTFKLVKRRANLVEGNRNNESSHRFSSAAVGEKNTYNYARKDVRNR